jgi:spore germination protein KC
MIVFGEDAAKEGIQDVLDFFARDHEFRTDFYFIVAKETTANNVLSILTPLDSIPGIEMYDSLKASERVWAPTKSVRIIELVNSIIADGENPVLTGVEITGGSANSSSTDALKQSDQIKKLKYTHLGAFKNDKLVGWLNEDESKGYNYICGNIKSTVGHSNYGDKVKITFEVKNAKSEMKASFVNGKPVIDVEINVKQNVGAVEGEFDVSIEENKKILNKIAEKKIKLLCEKVVKKAQNDLKIDIFGFGEVIHRKYPRLWEEIKDDWDNEFEDLRVNIIVKFETKQLGQITKSFFIKEKE